MQLLLVGFLVTLGAIGAVTLAPLIGLLLLAGVKVLGVIVLAAFIWGTIKFCQSRT